MGILRLAIIYPLYSFSKVFAYLFVHDSVKSSLSAGKGAIIYENEYKFVLSIIFF